ncbi:MAG: hypothetical protein ABSG65_10670 [Bryobacteraceae bacterium]
MPLSFSSSYAAVFLLLLKEPHRPGQATLKLPRDRLSRPIARGLHLASLRMPLHRARQLLQNFDALFRTQPPRAALPRAGQPRQDRIVQVGPLLRHALLVPMQHRQRGQHHRVAGDAPDLRPAFHCLDQVTGVALGPLGVFGNQRGCPPLQEHAHSFGL